MNLSTNILDPELYTPQATYWRSPFLFTVSEYFQFGVGRTISNNGNLVCAVASRFYEPRRELYQQAMHYARLAAGTALIGGRMSVEVVQAYTLLMLYPVPCRRWEEDRTWIYLGLAIRWVSRYTLLPRVFVLAHMRFTVHLGLPCPSTSISPVPLSRRTNSMLGSSSIVPALGLLCSTSIVQRGRNSGNLLS